MDIVTRAQALAALLADPGVTRAYADPEKAYNNRPCLLVAPPSIDWTEGSWTDPQVTWRIVALSSYPVGTLAAVDELSGLIGRANDVLEIEKATPAQYRLNAKTDPVAAYLCTHTEIEGLN